MSAAPCPAYAFVLSRLCAPGMNLLSPGSFLFCRVGGALPGLRLCAKQALRPGEPPCPMPSVLSRLVGGTLPGLRLCTKQSLRPGYEPCRQARFLFCRVGGPLSGLRLCTKQALRPGEGMFVLIGSSVHPAGIFCLALPKNTAPQRSSLASIHKTPCFIRCRTIKNDEKGWIYPK